MEEDKLWMRLIESLDAWTAAAQVAPGRIEVAASVESSRVVYGSR